MSSEPTHAASALAGGSSNTNNAGGNSNSNSSGDLNLTDLSNRVNAAWAYVQRLQDVVGKGTAILENQSIQLKVEAACRDEELRTISDLMRATEDRCAVHQQRLVYHYRLGNALDRAHQQLLTEEATVAAEIQLLKADAREAQLQANLSNNAVADALEAVSGLRMELWTLQRELTRTIDGIHELHQRQWALEDAVDAAEDGLQSDVATRRRNRSVSHGLFNEWDRRQQVVSMSAGGEGGGYAMPADEDGGADVDDEGDDARGSGGDNPNDGAAW